MGSFLCIFCRFSHMDHRVSQGFPHRQKMQKTPCNPHGLQGVLQLARQRKSRTDDDNPGSMFLMHRMHIHHLTHAECSNDKYFFYALLRTPESLEQVVENEIPVYTADISAVFLRKLLRINAIVSAQGERLSGLLHHAAF